MEYKELFNRFLKDNCSKTDFKLNKIAENKDYVFGYLESKSDFDVPKLVLNKKTNEILDEITPPFTDDENSKTIWESEKSGENLGQSSVTFYPKQRK